MAGWLIIDNLEAENRTGGDAEILADIAAVNKLSGTVASAASVATNSRMTPESIAEASAATASNQTQLSERLSEPGRTRLRRQGGANTSTGRFTRRQRVADRE